MSSSTIFSIVIFLSFLILISAGLFTSSSKYSGLTNQSNTNMSIISSGSDLANVRMCDYTGDIPLLSAFIWGADCIADFVGYLFGFAGIGTGIEWLSLIFVACIVALIYLGIKLLRGGG